MKLENFVMEKGREIFEKVRAFVIANEDDDHKFYNCAILKLSDGRRMTVSFDEFNGPDIKIDNYYWNDKIDDYSGDCFTIMPKANYGFSVSIELFDIDKTNMKFVASEKEIPIRYIKELTDQQKKYVETYIMQLYNQLSSLEYDKEATHSINNMNPEVRREYNIQQFNLAIQKMRETNSESNILPSVEAAVNWWIDQFTKSKRGDDSDIEFELPKELADEFYSNPPIDKHKLEIFKLALSRAIMKELSQGNQPVLYTDYSPFEILADAMDEAGISYDVVPLKKAMFVGVNSVRLNAAYQKEPEIIFSSEQEEENKKRI